MLEQPNSLIGYGQEDLKITLAKDLPKMVGIPAQTDLPLRHYSQTASNPVIHYQYLRIL
jgi:hypothetical protein